MLYARPEDVEARVQLKGRNGHFLLMSVNGKQQIADLLCVGTNCVERNVPWALIVVPARS